MTEKTKVRLLILTLFALLLSFTIPIDSDIFNGSKRVYPVYFTNIGTLDKGAQVKQAGLNVGKVTSIAMETIMEPTPAHYIVAQISVDDKARIAYDTKASILTMGMMGEQYIELSYGVLDAAPEGTRIEGQGSQQLDRIMADASGERTEISTLIQSLNIKFSKINQ